MGINLVVFAVFGPGTLEEAGILWETLGRKHCGNLMVEGGVGKRGFEEAKVAL